MRRRRVALALGLVAALGLGLDVWQEVNVTRLVETTLRSVRWHGARPLVVLQLSDVHGHVVPEGLIEDVARRTAPDLIAVTGDWLDADTEDLEPMLALADRLVRVGAPVYYVPGNHEHANRHYPDFARALGARGVTLLVNEHVVARLGGEAVTVAGVDDPYFHRDRLEQALAGAEASRYTLLLAHAPGPERKLAGTPVDVVLTGHTHGGQVCLPGLGAIYVPGQGFFPPLVRGVYELGDERRMLIDSGLGTSILPVRFGVPSQLGLVRIEAAR